MSKYKQTNILGESYIRADQIIIHNRLGKAPEIIFAEEQVMNIGDEQIHRAVSNCSDSMTAENSSEEFNLINPETGDVIGTSTYQQFAVMLHSLYFHVAGKRDASQEPEPVEN